MITVEKLTPPPLAFFVSRLRWPGRRGWRRVTLLWKKEQAMCAIHRADCSNCFKAQPSPSHLRWEVVFGDGEQWVADFDSEEEAAAIAVYLNRSGIYAVRQLLGIVESLVAIRDGE
jgi:hypothetical protein